MVQLSSRYDSTLKKKVFILKGDEAYARTTEVIANLITFDDFDNHINYCHVGLEIEVLRELGESYLYIYNNDEMLYDLPIPYNDSGMAEIIDSEWNEKGVYWIDNKLVIGKKSENPLVNTGLYLPYDVENKIRVEYIGNKHCLSSESKPIPLIVPTPDTFESTLTLWSDDPRYSPSATVNDVELLFECENETENSKTVKIYDNDNLVTTETVVQDVPVTLTLGELSDGLHILKAVFEGDDEAYASETSYSISVGYKIINLEYSQYVVQGGTGSLSCKVLDYLDEPITDLGIEVREYTQGTGWEAISDEVYTLSDGSVSFDTVQYSSKPFAVGIGSWTGTQHTTNIINPTSITLNVPTYAFDSTNVSVNGGVYEGNDKMTSVSVPVEVTWDTCGSIYDTTQTVNTSQGEYSSNSRVNGITTVTATVKGSQISTSDTIHGYSVFYRESVQHGTLTLTNATKSSTSNGWKFTQSGGNIGKFVVPVQSAKSEIKLMVHSYENNVDGERFYIDGFELKSDLGIDPLTTLRIVYDPVGKTKTYYKGSRSVAVKTNITTVAKRNITCEIKGSVVLANISVERIT